MQGSGRLAGPWSGSVCKRQRPRGTLTTPSTCYSAADAMVFAEEGVEAIFNELLGIGSIHAD